MNKQVILVRQGEKLEKCKHDIIYYELSDTLNLFSNFFNQKLDMNILTSYPKNKS